MNKIIASRVASRVDGLESMKLQLGRDGGLVCWQQLRISCLLKRRATRAQHACCEARGPVITQALQGSATVRTSGRVGQRQRETRMQSEVILVYGCLSSFASFSRLICSFHYLLRMLPHAATIEYARGHDPAWACAAAAAARPNSLPAARRIVQALQEADGGWSRLTRGGSALARPRVPGTSLGGHQGCATG